MENRFLEKTTPALILLSGEDYKAFTKNFQKPFDELFLKSMEQTLTYLCSRLPQCIFGYSQSFDIALILDPSKASDESWFNRDMDQIISLAASIATFRFNHVFEKSARSYVLEGNNFDATNKLNAMQAYVSSIDRGAFFTAQCFNGTPDEIIDFMCIRQNLYMNTAVSEVGLLPYEESPLTFRRGLSCVKNSIYLDELIDDAYEADAWVIDRNIPVFSKCRTYIKDLF